MKYSKLVFKNTNEFTRDVQLKALLELILKRDNAWSMRLSYNQSKLQMGSKTSGTLIYKICQNWNEIYSEVMACGNFFTLNKAIKTQAIDDTEECNRKNC